MERAYAAFSARGAILLYLDAVEEELSDLGFPEFRR
jgi:hypothetical protein